MRKIEISTLGRKPSNLRRKVHGHVTLLRSAKPPANDLIAGIKPTSSSKRRMKQMGNRANFFRELFHQLSILL